jgi:GNAT superfamily N-acetyltransferase
MKGGQIGMPLVIRKAESTADIKRFMLFPYKLYKKADKWNGQLLIDRKMHYDRKKNPFFRHSPDVEFFLAERDGEVCGTICALVNERHNSFHDENIAFFGHFEFIDDQAVSRALFDKAVEWARSRGKTAIRGPASYSSNEEWGLLVEGFEHDNAIIMAWNYAYYKDHYESFGLVKAKDLISFSLDVSTAEVPEKVVRIAGKSMARSGVSIRTVNKKKFDDEVQRFRDLYNACWEKNWGFVPETDEEFTATAEGLRMLINPQVLFFVDNRDGRTVALQLCLPDLAPVFKKIGYRLFPFGFFGLLRGRNKPKRLRLLTTGILPDYRKIGIDAVLYNSMLTAAKKMGVVSGDISWQLEDNFLINEAIRTMGGQLYKTHRVYELPL